MKTTSLILSMAFVCASCSMTNEPQAKPDSYVGTWSLGAVRGLPADSIQALQRLSLIADSTYRCTFRIATKSTHDTLGFAIPYKGKWEVTVLHSNYGLQDAIGIIFSPSDTALAVYYTISGGRQQNKMLFTVDGTEEGLSWHLVQ